MAKRCMLLAVVGGLLLQSCILYFFRDTDLGGWEFVGPRYFGDERSTALDIAETADGTLVVSYVAPVSPDSVVDEQARFVTYDGRRWVEYAPNRPIAVSHDRTRVGVLDDSRLCLAVEWSPIQVDAWNGSVWQPVPAPSGAEDLWCAAAAFAPDGTLYLALEDSADNYRLSFYAYAGGSWSPVGDPLGLAAADEVWMAMDGAGQAVVYHAVSGGGSDDVVVIYRENGAAWDTLAALPAGIGMVSQYSCRRALVASATDLYCVVVPDPAQPASSDILRYTGSGWEGAGSPLTTEGSFLVDVGFDQLGELLAIVSDDDEWHEFSAYQFGGTTWQLLGIPGFSFGDAPEWGALHAGSDGYLHVACIALGHDRRASTMRYPLSM